MKKSSKGYLVFGLAVYGLFLLLSFPAARAWSMIEKRVVTPAWTMEFSGIEGVWWSGRIDRARVNGLDLHDLRWSFRPFGLLRGLLQAEMRFTPPGGRFQAIVGLGREYIELTRVKANLPLTQLNETLSIFGMELAGYLVADMKKLTLNGRNLTAADGSIIWQEAQISMPRQLVLGDLTANLSTEKEGVRIRFADNGGPLSAEGVCTLTPDGQYNFSARLASRDAQQPELGDAIKLLGAPGGDGKVALSFIGKLPQF